MGVSVLDLHEVLKSKRNKFTLQEEEIYESCTTKIASDFLSGALAGFTAVWSATFKLSKLFRLSLSVGAGYYYALRLSSRSSDSCAEQILAMDGSMLQKELANIMVTKYQNDSSQMWLMSKHLYLERVFDDSTSNSPKLRWRYRNFFSDNAVHDHHWLHDHESYENSQDHSQIDSNDKSKGRSENVTGTKRINLKTKCTFDAASVTKLEVDPLDFLFGYAAPVEVNDHSNSPNKPSESGIHNLVQRRSHRRRRMRNDE
ncbi:uncharacterized protein LOC109810949 [Cajanus cajan]|uniref:uncharacterized protein LOC109810949 n=1 Tax=Cajanus cajan TaxID=3821 RepID=UPI00098DC92B|nr:uncharacterized protein LOC109810949 [Cajanus cajan]